MFAKYPRTPSDSMSNTPFPQARRRLRCKMCRQELATREHMVNHGQVGAATPAAIHTLSPAVSRRPSAGESTALSRRGSSSSDHAPNTRRMSRSTEMTRRPSLGRGLIAMTPITTPEQASTSSQIDPRISEHERRPSASEGVASRRTSFGAKPFGGLSMSSITASVPPSDSQPPGDGGIYPEQKRRSLLGIGGLDQHIKAINGLSVSALESDDEDGESHGISIADNGTAAESLTTATIPPVGLSSSSLSTPQELATRIHPNLAALRSSPLISALSSSGSLGMTSKKDETGGKQRTMSISNASPPLLMPNATCSGYFVEPVSAFI